MSDPNSQDRRRDPPFSATLRAPFLFRDRWPIPACGHTAQVYYTKVCTLMTLVDEGEEGCLRPLNASKSNTMDLLTISIKVHRSFSVGTSKVSPWWDCDRWLCWWCDWPRCVCARCVCARCEMCVCASESASRPALPLPPLWVDEDEEEVEPRWAGPRWEGRLIQCSMPDMSSPGPASSSEPDDESEHRGDRPSESQ